MLLAQLELMHLPALFIHVSGDHGRLCPASDLLAARRILAAPQFDLNLQR